MKKSIFGLIATTVILIPFHSMATSTKTKVVKPAVKCIQSEREFPQAPKIQKFVARIGGITKLEGMWKLGGFAGKIKEVLISFESASDGLKALVKGLDPKDAPAWGPIAVCDTIRDDTLQVKVIKTSDSLYMRIGGQGTLQLAKVEDGNVGDFYSFFKKED